MSTKPLQKLSEFLQLLSNEVGDRKVANVAKKIAYDGDFGDVVKRQISLEKSLFLLDALEIGKRKYSKLRQLLISDHVHLPAYNKVAELRNELILKSSIQFYHDPSNPIGFTIHIAFLSNTP